jgi:hypothetical protein
MRTPNEHLDNWLLLENKPLQDFSHEPNSLVFEFPDGTFSAGQYIIGTRGSSVLDVPEDMAASVASGILLVPNPTTGRVTLYVQPKYSERVLHITVSDLLGRMYEQSEHVVDADGEQVIQLDLSSLPNGSYLVKVNNRSVMVSLRK